MELFDVILKLIHQLGLSDSTESFQMLRKDTLKWRDDNAHKDTENKFGEMYYKLHQGPWARLAFPFLYFWIFAEVRKLMSGQPEEEWD